MSELSALDILGKQFARRFRGYAPFEVHEFLSQIASVVEALNRDRGELRQRLHRCKRTGKRHQELSDKIEQARDRLPMVTYTDRDLFSIAALTSEFRVDGHRADIVILKAARAQAAFDARLAVTDRDILLAAELALPHRLKRQPFQEAVLEPSQLEDRLRKAQEQAQADATDAMSTSQVADPSKKALRGPNR